MTETPYVNNIRHGVVKRYDDNGQLKEEVLYENGKKIKG
jgi:antitoxin component YwqK of YwqJK toxin-antitoxin module